MRLDLPVEQFAVPHRGFRTDLLKRDPLLDPAGDIAADRLRRTRDMLDFADSGDPLGEFDLRLALRAFEASIFGNAVAGCIAADVELELERAGAALANVTLQDDASTGRFLYWSIASFAASTLLIASSIAALTGLPAKSPSG
jgi:hypothetical protein